jgi:hypothetical protein
MTTTSLSRRLNALTHGIMSREALITTGDSRENEQHFQQISDALYDQYQPGGPIEQLLVEQLIALLWRWRRVIRFENAAIRSTSYDLVEQARRSPPALIDLGFYKTPDPNRGRNLDAELSSIDEDLAALDLKKPLDAFPALAGRILESAEPKFGVSVEHTLDLQGSWRLNGPYSRSAVNKILNAICAAKSISAASYWDDLRTHALTERDRVLALIARRGHSAALAVDLALVPAEPRRYAVQRYESHIARQFYRALRELDRLQSRRDGNTAPIEIEAGIVDQAPAAQSALLPSPSTSQPPSPSAALSQMAKAARDAAGP